MRIIWSAIRALANTRFSAQTVRAAEDQGLLQGEEEPDGPATDSEGVSVWPTSAGDAPQTGGCSGERLPSMANGGDCSVVHGNTVAVLSFPPPPLHTHILTLCITVLLSMLSE